MGLFFGCNVPTGTGSPALGEIFFMHVAHLTEEVSNRSAGQGFLKCQKFASASD